MKKRESAARPWGLVRALLFMFTCPALGNADDPVARAADFIGLGAGVDPDDGSFTQRAITCEEDDTCQVLGSDQFFSFCPEDEGRGILEGTDMFEEGVLSLPVFTLTCASGDAVGFPTIFSLDRSNGTLIEDTDGPPATITFHRLSPRLRHSFEGALITKGFDHSAGSFSRRNVAARAAIAA